MTQREKPKMANTRQKSLDEYREFTRNTNVLPYLQALLTDFHNILPSGLYGSAALAKDLLTLKTRYESEGLTFATVTLPKLMEGLLQYFEVGSISYPGFALDKNGMHPLFLRKLFALAYNHEAPLQTKAIELIYQFSVSFSKLKGPYLESVLRKQLSDLVETDKWFDTVDLFTADRLAILQQARVEIMSLFKDNDVIDRSLPRPGPGATNTPVAKHLRFRPKVLYKQVNDVVDYTEYFWNSPLDLVHQTEVFLRLKMRNEPTSRQKFVHKKVGKARGICIEENEVQYLQQAFRRSLYNWIETHPLTEGRISFRKQCVNQLLALSSSADLEMATVDESEASNRIFRDVVAWLFQDVDFFPHLMALSTRTIVFDDFPDVEPLRTNMYAPMGSALCFPIMSLVHWALARAIFFLHGGTHRMNDIYVYGDDIIVHTDVVELLYEYFPLFGPKINTNKSFYRSKFRESCGVHAYNGEDITPIYFKYIPNKPSIKRLMSVIAVEEQLYRKNYRHVAQKLREEVVGLFGQLPLVSATSPVLGFKRAGILEPIWAGPTKVKYDVWGTPQVRCRVVSPKQRKDKPPTEYECYMRHVLTRTSSRKMAGNPSSFSTKWRYVTLPGVSGINTLKEPPAVENTYLNKIEACYEHYHQFYQGVSTVVHTASAGEVILSGSRTIAPLPRSRLTSTGSGHLCRVQTQTHKIRIIPGSCARVGRPQREHLSNQGRIINTQLVRIIYSSQARKVNKLMFSHTN